MFFIPEHFIARVGDGEAILCNLVNGNGDIINDALAAKLESRAFDAIGDNDIEELISRGYLHDSEASYKSMISQMESEWLEQAAAAVPNFVFIPTYTCNLDCYYCFEKAYQHSADLKPQAALRHAVDFMVAVDHVLKRHEAVRGRHVDPGQVSVTITGGEPLLPENKKVIEYLLRECDESGYKTSIVTNGYEVPLYMDLFERFRVDEIQLTIEGSRRVHDSIRVTQDGERTFDVIASSVGSLASVCNSLSVRINASRKNIDSLSDTSFSSLAQRYPNVLFYVYLMQQEGCAGFSNVVDELSGLKRVFALKDETSALDNLDVSYHGERLVASIFDNAGFHPKVKMCAGMQNQYIFDYQGRVFKCWWGMGNDSFRVGSYSGKGVEIDQDRERPYLSRSVLSLSRCRQCKFRFLCGGGCTGRMTRSSLAQGVTQCPDFNGVLAYMIRRRYSAMAKA